MERRMKAFKDTITTVIWLVTAIWFFEAQYRSWNNQIQFENDVISAFLFFCMCVLALNIYFWTSAKLMWVMYRRHRHEFKLHAFSLLSQHLLTYLGLTMFTVYQVQYLYSSVCYHVDVGERSDGSDICSRVDDLSKNTQLFGTESMVGHFVFMIMAAQLPIAGFLLFSKEDDYFRCFGKDPTRNYSIHQLSMEEKIQRKMISQYGKKNGEIKPVGYDSNTGLTFCHILNETQSMPDSERNLLSLAGRVSANSRMTTEVNSTPKVGMDGPVFGIISALDEEVILRNAGTNHNSSNS